MIVVSDTTPLNYLVLISAIDVLPKLFDEIFVPSAVLRELNDSRAPAPVRAFVYAGGALLFLLVGEYGTDAFIYFQF